ncbi:hypothetical protein ACIBUR_24080 [Streptomyces anulatus]
MVRASEGLFVGGLAYCFAVQTRHNASDSGDEHDVLFVGWPDDTKESRR